VDSLRVEWPSGKGQVLAKLAPNQTIWLQEQNAAPLPTRQPLPSPIFRTLPGLVGFRHAESEHNDFKLQFTLPHKYSQNGFGLAVGDVDANGREDVYAGGAFGASGSFFLQTADGKFQARPLAADTLHEDLGTLLFDADGDADLDLYVVSGGSEQAAGSDYYQDRLYLNDGQGHFAPAAQALPDTRASGSCVVAADYDADGDLDLFVGGRVVPNQYPLPPRSYLLRNDSRPGQPKFTDVTPPNLAEVGMVTAALWTDVDNDQQPDLLLVGEFMPLTLFKNDRGNLTKKLGLEAIGNPKVGWWNSLAAGDFDNDGDTDYVAGNLGLNSRYQASERQPVSVYAKDFDKNGRTDAVLCHYYADGKCYLAHPRDNFVEQMPIIKKSFTTYRDYATTPFEEVFAKSEMEGIFSLQANYFASSYIENLGGGKLAIRPLPTEAQFAPLYGLAVGDYNDDGHLDMLAVGNSYAPEVNWGRYDASFGLCLLGDGKGSFRALPNRLSGLQLVGDAKGLAQVCLGPLPPADRPAALPAAILVALNSVGVQALAAPAQHQQLVYRVPPGATHALLTLKNGQKRKQEFYNGSTYLSHTSRTVRAGGAVAGVAFYPAPKAAQPPAK
jgi:hypothetical protein